jgi:hypothetical protein
MKGELIPTMLYADGRPRDVGTDRALANALNVYVDRKSAHQSPWLVNDEASGQNSNSIIAYLRAVFFGTEHVSATVERFVTVAPWFRSSDGGSTTITVTLTDTLPTYRPGKDFSTDVWNPSFAGKYAQATWTTTSTTWTTGADATLSLGVKDLNYGFAFLIINTAADSGGSYEYRGLAKCIEGIRVVG